MDLKLKILNKLKVIDRYYNQSENNKNLLKLVSLTLDFFFEKKNQIMINDQESIYLYNKLEEYILRSNFIKTLPTAFEYFEDIEGIDRLSVSIYLIVSKMNIKNVEFLFDEQFFCFFENMLKTPKPSILFDVISTLANFTFFKTVQKVLITDYFFTKLLDFLEDQR